MRMPPRGNFAATATGDRPTGSKKLIIVRLAKYLARFKWLLLLALILIFVSNLLALVGPKLSGEAINAIRPGEGAVDFEKVFFYTGLMAVCYIVSAILSFVLSTLMITLTQKVVYQMRKDIFAKLMQLPVGYFDRHQTGEIISKISYDVDTLNASLSNDILQIFTSIITVVVSLVMMLTIAPQLVLVFAVTIPVSVIITIYKSKKVRPLFRRRSQKLGELNGFVEEMISGQKTIKAYNMEDTVNSRFDVKNFEAVEGYFRTDLFNCTMGPTVNFINNLSLSLVSIFGALLYLVGGITLGDISSFVLYSRKFSGPINEMSNIIGELQSAFAAAERIFRLLDEQTEPADVYNAKVLSGVKGDVKLEHVCFGYEPEREIVHDLSMDAKSGKLIAIVGHTGAGKTTLINLLMRFYDVNSGLISVDGNDIREVTRDSLRLSYTMVLQDTWLFDGTVFDNIAYGKENATREDVERVAKAAKIHDFIMALPNGYDTVLSDNATNISKGQKQLLTIARAMLLDSAMLILDEATSNVDTQTEMRIQSAMRSLMEGRTCFIIAHRLCTIKNADHILVVDKGNIVEQGTHAELMAKKGFYADLYYSQFESY